MYNFPDTPTTNQVITGPNGTGYKWDGTKWTVSPGSTAYLPLSGGTISGNLAFNNANIYFGTQTPPTGIIASSTIASLGGASTVVTGQSTNIAGNLYLTTGASVWNYLANGTGSIFAANANGNCYWYTAPSGTAGAAASLTQTMVLNSVGTLSCGNPIAPGMGGVTAGLNVMTTPGASPTYYWETTTAVFQDNRAWAQGVGGGIVFGGKIDAAGSWAALAGMQARKSNATSGDAGGSLEIWARGGYISFLTNGAIGGGGSPYMRVGNDGSVWASSSLTGKDLWCSPRDGSQSGAWYITVGRMRLWYSVDVLSFDTGGSCAFYNNTYPNTNNAFYSGYGGQAWYAVCAYNYPNQSDLREKADLRALPDCLSLVQAIEPYRYRWNHGPDQARTHWGFVAQHVDKAMREAGHDFGGHVVWENGSEALNYNELLAVLWRAVQELSAKVK